MNGIAGTAKQGIALIENVAIRRALESAYQSPQGVHAAQIAQRVFDCLTTTHVTDETLCRFLAGWHATHGTSQFVSGLIVRMLREAERAAEPSKLDLYHAAGKLGEIIPEDTGVDGTPHNELFAQFANHLLGSDRWRLDRYLNPACERFRAYVKEQRLYAPIDEAILTTAASENWNSGEYTYFDASIRAWMTDILDHPLAGLADKVTYVAVHAGNTELGHFLHAMHAWQLYCKATGSKIDPMKANHIVTNYLHNVGSAFEALAEVLADPVVAEAGFE